MKKITKKILNISLIAYRWVIISIIIQTIGLCYIDKVYLTDDTEAKVAIIETTQTEVKEKAIKVDIPKDAKDIKVSNDGSHFAYNVEGELFLYSIEDKEIKNTIPFEKDILTFYKWLPDRNIIIYASRAPEDEQGRVNVMTYDVITDTEHEYPKITNGLPKNSEVVDLELSPFTNVLYLKVKASDTQARIFKFNIMDQLSFIMNIDINSIMKKTNYRDNLIYQNENNKLFQREGSRYSSTELPFEDKMLLLGVDEEDKVYVVQYDKDDKFSCLYKGDKPLEEKDSWLQVNITKPTNTSNVLITKFGEVFEKFENENYILDLVNDEKISYTGKLVEVLKEYIVSQDDDELVLKNYKTKTKRND